MNRWHIVTCEYPPDVGGVSDYTRLVAEGLAEHGEEVHVWCPPSEGRRAQPGVHVHAEAGRFRLLDLRRLSRGLTACPGPRRLLVQWVPHGYGCRSMNVWFCLWLAWRAWAGDDVQLMVHEPFLELKRRPLRHLAMALVHRIMMLVLVRSASKVWVAIPAWESALRPFALGRALRMEWLPIASAPSPERCRPTRSVRALYAAEAQPLLGHFGSYGPHVSSLLEARLAAIMKASADNPPAILLIGEGGERFQRELARCHPTWSRHVHATGYVHETGLATYLEACDLLLQPYPDGITSRRTSAIACLAAGRPVVTTAGRLTEDFWAGCGAVRLVDVSDVAAYPRTVAQLLQDPEARRTLGQRAQMVCRQRFSLTQTVSALRAA